MPTEDPNAISDEEERLAASGGGGLSRRRSSAAGLNDSMRKKPFKATYITVENQEGVLEHIPVAVNDEAFTNKEKILESLAQLGEIEAPPSPKPGNKLVNALR